MPKAELVKMLTPHVAEKAPQAAEAPAEVKIAS
jgi:hypothetical protein